ncbi:SDR family oxidoreductase [Anaerobaca lacustris]|uniref:SDR family oxidoreductase n=1 Tax=Anaerobaca lacustris TaxID=3044600 RepID=A0AAW6U5K1_9BACT|nr:SDR family oxidoreductase [Sedimentisphaerales bacterium M17dextr]
MPQPTRILVTGATGYVGSRLAARLLDEGHSVRVLVRQADRLKHKPWFRRVEIHEGDVCEISKLNDALSGIHTAYYLIHSMTAGSQFGRRDVELAGSFGRVARSVGLQRIIYLGGLGESGEALSEHLRSRQETGQALRSSGVPVTELRAAVIVGAGSISFEMVRYLTERIPLMICPRWVFRRIQPIAIDDVLSYLVAALDLPIGESRTIEIGGADVLTYGKMIKGYARLRGLRRVLLPVPVLTPRLSSHWVHWTTPVPATYARPLIEGLRCEVVVRNDDAAVLFPQIRPMGYEQAVSRALVELIPESFQDAVAAVVERPVGLEISRTVLTDRGMIVEVWQKTVRTTPETAYRAFCSLGGKRGWLYMSWAWRLRAWVDQLVGGVGMRRGRPEDRLPAEGDPIDSFQVERMEPGRLLRLRADMKLPGAGWLQFEARPVTEELTRLVQAVFYAPRGVFGLLYWYTLNPVHRLIFAGLLERLADVAERDGAPRRHVKA